jgi:sulfate transport system ATP-binding protein
VTHDQEEAMEVADRIVVMNQGRIEQEGTPDQVYDHPATPFVLEFLGDVNLFHGRDHAPGAVAASTSTGNPQDVSYVRPHEIQVLAHAEPGSLPVTLVHALTVGPNTRLEFKREDGKGEVDVEVPRAEYAALRDSGVLQSGVTLHLKPRRVRSFSVVNGGQGGRPEFVATDPGAVI